MARKNFISLNISRHTTQWVFDNFRYLLFLFILLIIYIANAHWAEQNVREIQLLQREIKDLKWEYSAIVSNLMYRSMQSQIADAVKEEGLILPPEGPKVIAVE